jgi:hypothetical protein
MILGRCSNQCNATDVNLFNSLWDRDINLGNGVFKGIEIADNVVNFVNILFGEVFLIGGQITSENSGVDLSDIQDHSIRKAREYFR